MNKTIYYYDIHYKKEWEYEVKKLISISEVDLEILLQWLKNCAVSFWSDGDMIKWIDDLEIFKIIQKNYFKENDGEYEIHFLNDRWEQIEIDVDVWKMVDITNKKLIQYKIRSWYYKRMWNVVLEGKNLYVDNHLISKLEKNRKPIELISLILEIPYKEKFTYTELKEFYDNSHINFQELKRLDLNEISLREILWKKIRAWKDKTHIEFIEISSNFISLWKEKES